MELKRKILHKLNELNLKISKSRDSPIAKDSSEKQMRVIWLCEIKLLEDLLNEK